LIRKKENYSRDYAMGSAYQIRSITGQILDALFEQLGEDNEINPALIDSLRELAKTGKMVDSEEIIRVITTDTGVTHEGN